MVGLAILIGSTNAVPVFYFNAAAPTCTFAMAAPRRALAETAGIAGIHDRPTQAALGSRGILLENQDVGGDVQRRMGKPVRRLRALLPGKARGRGYRQDLFHPRFLQASGCGAMCLQGLWEPLRQGSGLRQADARKRPHPELAAAALRLQARRRRPRSLLGAPAGIGRS